LLRRDWQATALIHYNSRANRGWLELHHRQPPPNLKVVPGDITDPFLVREALDGCEVVFHLAGYWPPRGLYGRTGRVRQNQDQFRMAGWAKTRLAEKT
jgi:nucleoside-diphosphate-sugar epimerase